MPLETLITPCLADFFEQVVEPLPESLFELSPKANSDTSSRADSMPIVALDTSSLPLDVLFHMSVQSSTVRFEGQQQVSIIRKRFKISKMFSEEFRSRLSSNSAVSYSDGLHLQIQRTGSISCGHLPFRDA